MRVVSYACMRVYIQLPGTIAIIVNNGFYVYSLLPGRRGYALVVPYDGPREDSYLFLLAVCLLPLG